MPLAVEIATPNRAHPSTTFQSTEGRLRARLEASVVDAQELITQLRADYARQIDQRLNRPITDEAESLGAIWAVKKHRMTVTIEQQHQRLVQLVNALDRLDSGCYGVCQSCGRSIDLLTLDMTPTATKCVKCDTW